MLVGLIVGVSIFFEFVPGMSAVICQMGRIIPSSRYHNRGHSPIMRSLGVRICYPAWNKYESINFMCSLPLWVGKNCQA